MPVRGYALGIDWFAGGDPGSLGEDDTSDVKDEEITVGWGRETTQAGSNPPVAQFVFSLRNDTKRYSPANQASPLYGYIGPGKRVLLQHTDPTAGDTITIHDGRLDVPVTDVGAKTLACNSTDAWGRPHAASLSTAVYSGLRTGDAVNMILDAIGWAGARAIDPGVTCMPFWWVEGDDAATAIGKLVDTEGPPAMAYVRGGTFVFEDRHHRTLALRSRTSAGLFTNVPTEPKPAGRFSMAKDSITYDHGLGRIVNSATFDVDQRAVMPAAEVWVNESPFWIDAGATVTFFVTATDPFINAVQPLEGSGIDSDTGIVVATVSRTSGMSAILNVTAAAGSTVNRLALTANPVAVARTVKVSAEDASSVARSGRNSWPNAPVFANVYDAQAIADRIVTLYASNRPVVTFDIENTDAAHFAQIRQRQVSDRITIRDDTLGLNDEFMIEGVKHTIRKWSRHRLTLTCEVPAPAQPENIFTFDVAGKGFDDGLFAANAMDNANNVFMFDPPDQNKMSIDTSFILAEGHPDTTALFTKTNCTFAMAPPGPWYLNAAQLVVVGGPASCDVKSPDSLPIVAGQQYRCTCWVYSASSVANCFIQIQWWSAAHANLGNVTVGGFTATPAGTLMTVGLATAPANAAFATVGPGIVGAPLVAGTTIYVNQLTFTRPSNGFDTGVFGS
jgi:hypothetical protein